MRAVAFRELVPVEGPPVPVPDPDRLVHLQFRRFAGCPICNVHLRSVAVRHAEIERAGVREVAVFHSPAADLREYTPDLPFAVVADPGRDLYREFGVEAGRRALLDPRVWPVILRSVAVTAVLAARGRAKPPSGKIHGGRLGLPGDFLIAPDGTIAASKLGEHAGDQWSVDELLARAARVPVG
ncbi:peroxiredoxin-like family protein [Actinomadura atramentaria]|uniref:peroxiredoxin-like family protein n=1 Tax=Actinomadura atramentaria TaxID=1990 RepID=UPI00036B3F2B|nr:peroxiredoxin-like family protein [Actinomadura atramentaria]